MKVYLHLAEGFEEIEALTVVDVLRRAGIDVEMVSISESIEVKGAHDIRDRRPSRQYGQSRRLMPALPHRWGYAQLDAAIKL